MRAPEASIARALADLRSDVALVRRHAIRELGRWGDVRVMAALEEAALREAEASLRSDAARAVEAIRLRAAASLAHGVTTERRARGDLPPETSDEGVAAVASDSQADTHVIDRASRTAAENVRELERVRSRSKALAESERRHLIDEALKGLGIAITPKKYGYKLDVPLVDGRRQFVRVAYEQSDFENDKVVVVFSPCGPAKPKLYRWALELNHQLTYGKLGVHTTKDGDELVMSAALVEATADPVELRKAILSIAEKADRIEKVFWAEDRL